MLPPGVHSLYENSRANPLLGFPSPHPEEEPWLRLRLRLGLRPRRGQAELVTGPGLQTHGQVPGPSSLSPGGGSPRTRPELPARGTGDPPPSNRDSGSRVQSQARALPARVRALSTGNCENRVGTRKSGLLAEGWGDGGDAHPPWRPHPVRFSHESRHICVSRTRAWRRLPPDLRNPGVRSIRAFPRPRPEPGTETTLLTVAGSPSRGHQAGRGRALGRARTGHGDGAGPAQGQPAAGRPRRWLSWLRWVCLHGAGSVASRSISACARQELQGKGGHGEGSPGCLLHALSWDQAGSEGLCPGRNHTRDPPVCSPRTSTGHASGARVRLSKPGEPCRQRAGKAPHGAWEQRLEMEEPL